MLRERVILGTTGGLLILANALGHPAEARAEEAICGAVYDTVDPGTSSEKLQNEIRTYAVYGITVRALILAQAPAGVTDASGLAAYQEKIANRCNYADKGYLSVAVTNSPRLFNTQKNGKADEAITNSAVEAATPDFKANLRDQATPYQDDIAELLVAIDPSKAQAKPTSENRPPQEEPSRTEQAPINIPWLPIVGGLASAAVLTAAGARIARHGQITKMYRRRNGELTEEFSDSRAAIHEAEQLINSLPEDSARELRKAVEELKLAEGRADARSPEIADAFADEAKEIWPDTYDVDGITDNLSGTIGTLAQLRRAVVAEQKKFIQRRQRVETDIAGFNQLVSDCTTLLNTLQFGDWDVKPLEQEFTEITDEAALTIGELRVNENVEKLEAALGTNLPLLTGVYDKLAKVETDRQTTDEKIDNQPSDVATVDNAIHLATTQFAALKTEYNASCYEDLTDEVNGLAGSRTKLDSLCTAAQKTVGQKNYVILQESIRLTGDFDATLADITSITQKVAQRTETIAAIKENLPKLLSSIAATLSEAHEYAFSKFTKDVEDDTRQWIEDAQKDLESFTAEEVSARQPNYLALEKAGESHKQNADTLLARAHAEKAQMDELRSRYRKYVDEASRTYRSLATYISRHSSDLTGFGSPDVDLPAYHEGYTRKQLQSVIERLKQIQASIDQARADAERKVRRAEEERKAKRQAAIAAALALEAERQKKERERQQRQEAQRPSNSGGGFGPSNRGGGFGPSNTGGSF